MGIKERRIKEKKELRKKIIKAAEKLFAKGGYENLSMRKIATTIDYSPTTIYRFFKNKQDLLITIADNSYLDLSKKFEKIIKNQSLNSLEKLKLLIREYILFGIERPDIYMLYTNLAKLEIKDNGMYETIGGKSYRIFSSWQVQLDELIKKGKFKYTNSISLLLLICNTADGFIKNKINHPNLFLLSNEEEIIRLLDMVFNGLLKNKSN